jgi:hypothetical protein
MMSENWVARLQAEYLDVLQRMSGLQAFILTDKFETLPEADRKDLREQRKHMNAYWHVLARRAVRHVPGYQDDT